MIQRYDLWPDRKRTPLEALKTDDDGRYVLYSDVTALEAAVKEKDEQMAAEMEMSLGVGDGTGQMFVHGTRDAIKLLQDKILKMEELTATVKEQKEEIGRLNSRDGRATIKLILPNEDDPFYNIDLKVVDFGVADNCYVVEAQAALKEAHNDTNA